MAKRNCRQMAFLIQIPKEDGAMCTMQFFAGFISEPLTSDIRYDSWSWHLKDIILWIQNIFHDIVIFHITHHQQRRSCGALCWGMYSRIHSESTRGESRSYDPLDSTVAHLGAEVSGNLQGDLAMDQYETYLTINCKGIIPNNFVRKRWKTMATPGVPFGVQVTHSHVMMVTKKLWLAMVKNGESWLLQ